MSVNVNDVIQKLSPAKRKKVEDGAAEIIILTDFTTTTRSVLVQNDW